MKRTFPSKKLTLKFLIILQIFEHNEPEMAIDETIRLSLQTLNSLRQEAQLTDSVLVVGDRKFKWVFSELKFKDCKKVLFLSSVVTCHSRLPFLLIEWNSIRVIKTLHTKICQDQGVLGILGSVRSLCGQGGCWSRWSVVELARERGGGAKTCF